MAIKFSQFNLRTDHTSGMYLVGYDGNQNIHITVDNLFDDFINGTENTIAMFGTGGTALADSILSQDAGATILTVAGQLNVDAAATFDTSVTVTGDSTLNGNVILGDASTDLITQTGTLYLNGPIKDTTNTLGIDEQILVSDAIGELTFRDLYNTTVGRAEAVVQTIKCNEAIPKGCPVYIVGFQPGENANIVEKADASNPAKMPATGVADEDYAAQDFGTMTAFGSFNGDFDTTGGTENWAIGDILYVKSGGGLTNIKPTGTNLIQNIAIVSRVQSQTGEMEVIALGRTNDIPNLTPGRLWVGSTGNTIESQTLFVDEANTQVGIGTASPGQNLHINESAANTVSYLRFSNAQTTNGFDIGVNTSNSAVFFNRDVSPMVFATSNSERMRIDSSGNVGIGTTSPSAKLVVVGEIRSNKTANGVSFSSTGGGASFTAFDVYTATNGGLLRLYDQNGQTVAIDARTDTATRHTYFNGGGNVGIGTTSPAGKLEVNGGTGVATSGGTLIVRQDGDTSNDGIALTSSNSISHRMFKNAGGTFLMGPSTNSEAFALDLNGNVGIGTASPGAKLEILSGSGKQLRLSTGATTYWELGRSTSTGHFEITEDSGDTYFLIDKDTGQLQLNEYGAGTFTGTVAKNLAVDSSGNVIETDSGVVDGSGTTNYVSKWFDSNTLTDSVIYDNGTNVGIGTASPSDKLHVAGSGKFENNVNIAGTGNLNIQNTTGSGSGITFIDTSWQAGIEHTAGKLLFRTGGQTDKMIIGSNGNVGIATTSPGEKLHVAGNIRVGDSTDTIYSNRFKGINNADVELRANNGYDLILNGSSGDNVGIGTASPAFKTTIYSDSTTDSFPLVVGQPNIANEFVGIGLSGFIASNGAVKAGFVLDRKNTYGVGDIHILNNTTTDNSNATLADSKFTILQNNNVGIGTTSPNQRLTVDGNIYATGSRHISASYDSNNYIRFESLSSGGVMKATAGGVVTTLVRSYGDSYFNGGNFGIGTTSPAYKLDVNGDGRINGVTFVASGATRIISTHSNAGQLQLNGGTDSSGGAYININGSGFSLGRMTLYSPESIYLNSNVGIGTALPASKLDVNGGIKMADDSSAASASNVGTLRYRTSGNNSYVDMCMQTGASTYAWVNIVQNNW